MNNKIFNLLLNSSVVRSQLCIFAMFSLLNPLYAQTVFEDQQIKYGIVNFHVPLKYSHAVTALKMMESDNLKINNALYLDMGAVSEGYFYDSKGHAHLLGDPFADKMNYTNVLVMYKDLIPKK